MAAQAWPGDGRAPAVLHRRHLDRNHRARRDGTGGTPPGPVPHRWHAILTWRLHWVTGWDTDAGEYRATLDDNYGHADVMRGYIDGDRLIYETRDERRARLRLTWDLADPAAPLWTNEVGLGGDTWQLIESYRMRPVASCNRSDSRSI